MVAVAHGLAGMATAAAQTPVAEDTAARRERLARIVFEDANRFLGEGKYREALERYEIAYELWPRPKTLLNMATLLLELGRKVDAANAFAKYLASEQSGDVEPERASKVRGLLAKLDSELGLLHVRGRTAGARGLVRIDGQVAGPEDRTGLLDVVVRVAPGNHEIVIEYPDGQIERIAATVAAGTGHEVVTGDADADTVASNGGLGASRARFLAFARGEIDVQHGDPTAAVGLVLRVTANWHAYGNALVGEYAGAELGARYETGGSTIRLRASASLPVIFADGPRLGGRAAIGAVVPLVWRVRAALDVGFVHRFSGPEGVDRSLVAVALAAEIAL